MEIKAQHNRTSGHVKAAPGEQFVGFSAYIKK